MAARGNVRAGLAVSTTALLALLAGCGSSGDKAGGNEPAAAGSAHYEDAVGDGGAGPDISAIDVTSTPAGRITFRITLDHVTSKSNPGVDLWLDTDADPETGNITFHDAGGAEYLLSAFPGGNSARNRFCGVLRGGDGCLSRWAGGSWTAAPAPSARVTRTESGLAVSIDGSDLGNPEELNFYAV